MAIPMYITIKNSSGQTTACLSPKTDSLKDCYIDTRLNGESSLEFLLPSTSEKITELTPECQIWAGGRVYTLLKPEAVDDVMDETGKLWSKFMAMERQAELDTSFIEPYITNDPSTPHPADLAVIIVSGGSNLSGGLYPSGTAAHALYAVLQGSGWTMGTADVIGVHDLEKEKVSRLQLIKEIQSIWGGYLVWDSENKAVHLRDGGQWLNYTGYQVRYAKNMKNITRTQSNRLITRMYGFGKDNLDFSSVNGGEKFVTNYSYTPRDYIGIYSNPDIDDPQELKDKTIMELSLVCSPRYLYSTKMEDLRTLPEYSHEDFAVGDMADVVNPKLNINDQARIIRHKYNLFKPWICELELGDPVERLVENLKAAFDAAKGIETGVVANTKQVNEKVMLLQTDIQRNADEITLKADKTVTDALGTRLSSAESSLIVNAEQIALRVTQTQYNTDMSSMGNRLSAAETSIIQNSSDIMLRATISTTDALNSRLSSAESAITVNANNIALKVSQTDYNGNTIASLINQSSTTIKLQASTIDLAGAVSFSAFDSSTQSLINGKTDQSQVTSIIGNVVTTGFVNALGVRAASVDAENLTGTYIYGKTIVGGVFSGGTINVQDTINITPSYTGGINFGNASIYREPGDGTMHINAGLLLYCQSQIGMILQGSTFLCAVNQLSFFGVSSVSRQTASLLSYDATLADVITKVNGALTRLSYYGLFQLI